MNTPPVVSPEEWKTAREELLVKEKEHTRARDALAAERRRYQDSSSHTLKNVEPMRTCTKRAGLDGANLPEVLSGRHGPSPAMLAKLKAFLAVET